MDYYNDNERTAVHWLNGLMASHLIPGGIVDDRSIAEVQAADLAWFRRCHFFAGIAGWAEALRIAEWPESWPVWTGSCPCQPFSQAGRRKGAADERHLWPEFLRLIDQCRPATVFGEQVASKLGREWLADVRSDMETLGYVVGAADLCAASIGAPHIRQRLYWVAHTDSPGPHQGIETSEAVGHWDSAVANGRRRMENTRSSTCGPWSEDTSRTQATNHVDGPGCRLGNAGRTGPQERISNGQIQQSQDGSFAREAVELASDHWRDVEWIECGDGKARQVKPGIQLLANGVQSRVAKLRGLGNAIVPQVAAAFVRSFMETLELPEL